MSWQRKLRRKHVRRLSALELTVIIPMPVSSATGMNKTRSTTSTVRKWMSVSARGGREAQSLHSAPSVLILDLAGEGVKSIERSHTVRHTMGISLGFISFSLVVQSTRLLEPGAFVQAGGYRCGLAAQLGIRRHIRPRSAILKYAPPAPFPPPAHRPRNSAGTGRNIGRATRASASARVRWWCGSGQCRAPSPFGANNTA